MHKNVAVINAFDLTTKVLQSKRQRRPMQIFFLGNKEIESLYISKGVFSILLAGFFLGGGGKREAAFIYFLHLLFVAN